MAQPPPPPHHFHPDSSGSDQDYNDDYSDYDPRSPVYANNASAAPVAQTPADAEEADITRKIKRLRGEFGRHLDADVLRGILGMVGNNYEEARGFLQAEEGGPAYDYQNYDPSRGDVEMLPADYNTIPQDWQVPAPRAAVPPEEGGLPAELEWTVHRLKVLFSSTDSFKAFADAYDQNTALFKALLRALLDAGADIPHGARVRILAVVWARRDYLLATELLSSGEFGLPEVLKALHFLDAPRRVRQYEKRLSRLHAAGKVKKSTERKILELIRTQKAKGVDKGSVSGAMAKQIRAWTRSIPAKDLEFFIIQMPKQPWQELADIVHPHPTPDFTLPWFLDCVYGKDPPEGSMAAEVSQLTEENVLELSGRHQIPYSYLRTKIKPGEMGDELKTSVAHYESLDTLIWYFEELNCPGLTATIEARLGANEPIKMGYGKLMERLLTFRTAGSDLYQRLIPMAQSRLDALSLTLESPVVVLGDASYSMDVAIRVSCIIASILTVLTNASLKFFNDNSVDPALVPRTCTDVLDLTVATKATGMTAPAVSLLEYYKATTMVKTFIVVTDEIENNMYEGHYFHQVFYKYYTEVYPSQLVFVSFLPGSNQKGRMVRAIEALGIPVLNFRLDATRPDLSKADGLVAMLASGSRAFDRMVVEKAGVCVGVGGGVGGESEGEGEGVKKMK